MTLAIVSPSVATFCFIMNKAPHDRRHDVRLLVFPDALGQ